MLLKRIIIGAIIGCGIVVGMKIAVPTIQPKIVIAEEYIETDPADSSVDCYAVNSIANSSNELICNGPQGELLVYVESEPHSTFGTATIYRDGIAIYENCYWNAISPWDSTNLGEFYINIENFDDNKITYTQYRFTSVGYNNYSYSIEEIDL